MTKNYLRRISPSKVLLKIKQLVYWSFRNSYKFGLILVLAVFLMKNDLSFEFNLNTVNSQIMASETIEEFSIINPFIYLFGSGKETKTNEVNTSENKHLSNDYSNMTYHEDAKNVSSISASGAQKVKKQQNYIKRFAEVARSEMRKYGIPASITLAQGLIESNAGESRLSKENNNHFGMKCFSKKCKKGHCANFTDDSHKDFFRKYETAWESYRAHSILLGGDRYKHLKDLEKADYKGWAIGLKKAGYATDKRYAEKLIHIIEEMQLYQFDN